MTVTSGRALMLQGGEQLFADSDTFRERIGTDDEGTAKKHVYFGETELPAESTPRETLAKLRPYVILEIADHQFDPLGMSDNADFGESGGLAAKIVDNPRATSHKVAKLDFEEYVGNVLRDIADLMGRDQVGSYTYFPFLRIRQLAAADRPRPAERRGDDFFEIWVLFEYTVGVSL